MWHIDTNVLILLLALITIFGFFLGQAMDGVLGDEGFGSNGNMGIIIAGFFAGLFLTKYLGFNMSDFRLTIAGGLLGSFIFLVSLVLTKNVMHRLGY